MKEAGYQKSEAIFQNDDFKSYKNIETDFLYLLRIKIYSPERQHHFWAEIPYFGLFWELFWPHPVAGSEFFILSDVGSN